MSMNEIREILKGNFESTDDRAYWKNKLEELEEKKNRANDNEKYFDEMIIYNR